MTSDRFAVLDALMDRYNAGDADGYAALFADEGVEAMYRGAELRVGKQGVRDGNAKTFADFPQNCAVVLDRKAFGEFVLVHEKVWRTPDGDPFEVMAIYSFDDGRISRVEFVRLSGTLAHLPIALTIDGVRCWPLSWQSSASFCSSMVSAGSVRRAGRLVAVSRPS